MAIVRRSSELPIAAETARELAQRIETFEFVVAPYIRIRGLRMPARITAGSAASGRLWWLGLVPSWRHHIALVRLDEYEIYTNEHGGPVRVWRHRLTFEPLGERSCRYTDQIELEDGWRAAPTRLFTRLMFRHRHRRWAQLARVLAPPSE